MEVDQDYQLRRLALALYDWVRREAVSRDRRVALLLGALREAANWVPRGELYRVLDTCSPTGCCARLLARSAGWVTLTAPEDRTLRRVWREVSRRVTDRLARVELAAGALSVAVDDLPAEDALAQVARGCTGDAGDIQGRMGELRERLARRPRPRYVRPDPAPIYDEVYDEGARALDRDGGQDLPP